MKNEKYKGDVIFQKIYTVDYLSKKTKKNDGEVPMFYVKNSHPAIIDPQIFDLVQSDFKNKKSNKGNNSNLFMGKVKCGDCGGTFGKKVWHSNSKYKRIIWQCNNKVKGKTKCTTPHLNETLIKDAFIRMINYLIKNKDELFKDHFDFISKIENNTELDDMLNDVNNEIYEYEQILTSILDRKAKNDSLDDDYKYNMSNKKYHLACSKRDELTQKITENKERVNKMKTIIKTLKNENRVIDVFSKRMFGLIIKELKVISKNEVEFTLKDEMVIPCIIG